MAHICSPGSVGAMSADPNPPADPRTARTPPMPPSLTSRLGESGHIATAPSVPSGWYQSPSDSTALQYWDGAQWTEHRQPAKANPPNVGGPKWHGNKAGFVLAGVAVLIAAVVAGAVVAEQADEGSTAMREPVAASEDSDAGSSLTEGGASDSGANPDGGAGGTGVSATLDADCRVFDDAVDQAAGQQQTSVESENPMGDGILWCLGAVADLEIYDLDQAVLSGNWAGFQPQTERERQERSAGVGDESYWSREGTLLAARRGQILIIVSTDSSAPALGEPELFSVVAQMIGTLNEEVDTPELAGNTEPTGLPAEIPLPPGTIRGDFTELNESFGESGAVLPWDTYWAPAVPAEPGEPQGYCELLWDSGYEDLGEEMFGGPIDLSIGCAAGNGNWIIEVIDSGETAAYYMYEQAPYLAASLECRRDYEEARCS